MPDAKLLQRLRAIVGPAGVVERPEEMAPYLQDYRGLYRGSAPCILRPAATAEVVQILALCNEARVGVVPQGGNTGYCGGAQPDTNGEQIVLSLGRLHRVRSVEPRNYSITVEAGCVLARVQQAAAAADRYFPLSLGAEGSCQIGGNLSTNAGGTAVLRYGMTRDLVLGLEVVLADGRVLSTLGSLRKDNTGYDLNALFVGAEGTLGVITAATLKLLPPIKAVASALVAIPGIDAAVDLLAALRAASADRLSTCEIMARSALELVARHIPGARNPFDRPHPWFLLVELQSTQQGEALDAVLEKVLNKALDCGQALEVVIASGGAERAAFLALAKDIEHGVHDIAHRHGGSFSAEHGIGQYKVRELQRHADPVELAMMTSIKRALDPNSIMNPGKLLIASA